MLLSFRVDGNLIGTNGAEKHSRTGEDVERSHPYTSTSVLTRLALTHTTQYQQFDIRNSHARHAQWGFLFGRVGDPDVQLHLDSVMVKASGWDKGVPRIEVKKIAANPANPNKRARLEDE